MRGKTRGNRGATTLRCRRPVADKMGAFDALPPELRAWVAEAALPWTARSVRRAYAKAQARTNDPAAALAALDEIQSRLLEKDAARVWGRAP